jgi:hypothetical protein
VNNLEFLIPQPAQPTDVFRFGVVTGTNPLRVQLDGDAAATNVTPIVTCPVGDLDRVLVQIHNRQLIIVGRVSVYTPVIELGNTENLNNLTDSRTYHQAQNAEASTSRNYPEATAGLLEVFNVTHVTSGNPYIYQRYTTYNNSEVWTRSYYWANGWYPWKRTIGGSKTVPWTTITGWDSTVELYNPGTPIRGCVVGGIVFLAGAMRWLSGTSGRIAQLPSWAYPDNSVIKAWRCQGSSNNAWGCEINGANELRWGRYGPAVAGTDTWLPFSIQYPQAD